MEAVKWMRRVLLPARHHIMHRNVFLDSNQEELHHMVKRGASRLTSKQISYILRMREMHHVFSSKELNDSTNGVEQADTAAGGGCIKSIWNSQLAANYPLEDRRVAAQVMPPGTGYILGVVDGHGGAACAQAVKEWLPSYIAISLLDGDSLEEYLKKIEHVKAGEFREDLVKPLLDPTDYVRGELFPFHFDLLKSFAKSELAKRRKESNEESSSEDKHTRIKNCIERAFLSFDRDILQNAAKLTELVPSFDRRDLEKLAVALSGAVCCFAFISGDDMYVASTGDCSVALGSVGEDESLVTKKLNRHHTVENRDEVTRILNEHPPNEAATVIRGERLLGQLYPLRSFGDSQYKWPLSIQKALFRKLHIMHFIPPNYSTPPYLTALPDVQHVKLSSKDRYIMLCSDGLVEWMTEEQALQLISDHQSGNRAIESFDYEQSQQDGMKLGDLNAILLNRKHGLKQKPEDENVATHLIRYALGSGEDGSVDQLRLSRQLSVPLDQARFSRDDITVTVAFFNESYFSQAKTN